MSLSGIAVVMVGLVSDPLFLHWLQSLVSQYWGKAFLEAVQTPSHAVGVKVFMAMLPRAGEKPNSTSLGWLWDCWG